MDLLRQEPDCLVLGEAADGKLALQQIARTPPDVVLLDVRMPVLDGIASTRRIRAEFPQVCVVGMSIGPDAKDTAGIQEAGAASCVDKGDPQACSPPSDRLG
jgi:DNA-binding NarL/FixJ family response regulator